MKNFFTLTALITLLSFSALAHEGHDHGAGQVQPTKGGVIMKAKNFYLEIAGTATDVMIYPLQAESAKSKVLKPIPLSEVKIQATYKLPRAKVAEALKLEPMKDHFHAKLDSKGSHRYEVVATLEIRGEKEILTYQIEP